MSEYDFLISELISWYQKFEILIFLLSEIRILGIRKLIKVLFDVPYLNISWPGLPFIVLDDKTNSSKSNNISRNEFRQMIEHQLTNIPMACIDGLERERRNSIANALELRISCTNTLTYRFLSCVLCWSVVLFLNYVVTNPSGCITRLLSDPIAAFLFFYSSTGILATLGKT